MGHVEPEQDYYYDSEDFNDEDDYAPTSKKSKVSSWLKEDISTPFFSTPNLSTREFSAMNFPTPDFSTMNFSTPVFSIPEKMCASSPC